ncbi:MAG: FG-GAP-like repeat-containing protein [Myxococcota bacterium]
MPRLPIGLSLIATLCLPAMAGGPSGAFPDCAEDNRAACPNDLGWTDLSWVPESSRETVRPEELELGSGVSLDRALRHTAGRWDVTVAVLDSGIQWQDTQLIDKVRLNLEELPWPQRSDGTEVVGGDLDGNGIVNVRDYAEDPRVDIAAGADPADDRLDPSDLIHTFSDGTDADGNGYVDDIAGWDFFEHDNDPWASFLDGYYNHGTGVAKTATAWANDGGQIGGCPDCSLLPIRIAEAFVTDGDRIALALAYIAENDVSAASMATGGLTLTERAIAAAEHADASGVVLVGAAGDENAWHRNSPSVASPFLFVKSVRALDRQESGGAYTWLSTWNCNNYGPRVDLVAPASECATGATARIAGLAGLVTSAARDQGISLNPGQIRNLLRATADDVNLSAEDQDTASALPSGPGWDAFHGYGRVNVGTAVQQLVDEPNRAEARITSPTWFGWSDGTVEVRGTASGAWVLEQGEGAEPDSWAQVASGSAVQDGVLATIEVSPQVQEFGDLGPLDTLLDRFERAHEPLIQFRLRVGEGLQQAEDRTAVWSVEDPMMLPGWPLTINTSMEASVQLADVDADGVFEVIIAGSDGRLRVVDGAGDTVPGWEDTRTQAHPHRPGEGGWEGLADLREGLIGTPAVADLDGDGTVEIVATGLGGGIYVWSEGIGGRVAQVPAPDRPLPPSTAYDEAILASPVIADLDPSTPERHILVADGAQRLWLFDGSGQAMPGYPIRLCHPTLCGKTGGRIVAAPAVGDVDGDGDLDAVVPTGEVPQGIAGVVHLIDLNTAEVTDILERSGLINQSLLPVIGEGHPSPAALADLDGDGDLELASAPMLAPSDLIHHDGSLALDLSYSSDDHGLRSSFTNGAAIQMTQTPAFGDLDGDGVPDPVVGAVPLDYVLSLASTRYSDHQHGMFAWSGKTGLLQPGFPRQVDGPALLTAPAIADVSGDGVPEVLSTSTGHFVYAHDASGALAPGFPHFHGGWAMGGPSVGDIDGDGFLDVVMATRDGLVFAWRTEGPADGAIPWPSARHDAMNTGNLSTLLPEQDGPSGCGGCSGTPAGAFPWFIGLFLLYRRRR